MTNRIKVIEFHERILKLRTEFEDLLRAIPYPQSEEIRKLRQNVSALFDSAIPELLKLAADASHEERLISDIWYKISLQLTEQVNQLISEIDRTKRLLKDENA